ncbi:F-box/kelch-repeat protein At3g27150 [Rosa rugosa]|uniref:F-box/kelch-repeat protein At3g27150 n=1 Tax=Rosa rugosa TaxID=74645 RepID=UPI002B407042|nr:F-box/kelch-repeat protein At3g27150 [Rosa rugosa]XP_062010333.1 F-box/kelch-repeat protein At3g27150 [Rosa rugosa]XP_062010334.1 F-box/kelch-repeat protein At3g27150 [Rosa rugosa]XP_062010335.1 F-box/kelch-repeat protein At3g27150 [Rosa rugosa]XP_062010336.1 F-box/kelch-repeat protein At3g27150 [Rosa rugosa]
MSKESRDSNLGDFGLGYHTSPPEKVRRRSSMSSSFDGVSFSSKEFMQFDCALTLSLGTNIVPKPKDADYCYSIPPLIEEVEALILARAPRSEYWKFFLVNKRFLALLKSGELYKIRSELGLKELSIFVSPCGERKWWEFDRQFKSCRKLPILPADETFIRGDRESLCAGTHLLVSGREIEGLVVWRYDMEANIWSRGPSMINPRCLFASATCGSYGYVAGGFGMVATGWEVMDFAERYIPQTKSWEPLPNMIKKRRYCSGCYMDNKFYVIGGRDPDGRGLSCAEAFDMEKKTWELIPDMLEVDDAQDQTLNNQSPPLIAVVNNELYSLETRTNELKVYMKRSKSWKKLGTVPVRADTTLGWGIAFKSLGNELLVIQSSQYGPSLLYTCCPNPNAEELQWEALEHGKNPTCFIVNCSVIAA